MSKEKELLSRFGSNLAESMGAGRVASPRISPEATPAIPSRHDGAARLKSAAEIDVDRIGPDPDQPRTEFDPEALARLAESIKTHGQIQPIMVRWSDAAGRYLVVAGERRWRAAALAGRRTLAAVVLDGTHNEAQVRELQLVENCLREDLRPIEQARAFRALMDRNGWTASRLAEALHLTGATVSRALALLGLPCTVQDAIAAGELAPSVAYELSKIDDPEAQREVADRAVAEGLNRSEVIAAVRRREGRSHAAPKGRGAKAKPKKTTATMRTSFGKLTLVSRRGVDDATFRAALVEALGTLDDKNSQVAA